MDSMGKQSEHALQNEIRNALAGQCLLFRAQVGQAWTGSHIERLPGNRVMIYDARPFSTGLPPGFSDTFGLVQTRITQDMVGSIIGQFLAGEVKTSSGHVSDKQAAFLQAIQSNGGRAGVWRSVDDATAMVLGRKGKM